MQATKVSYRLCLDPRGGLLCTGVGRVDSSYMKRLVTGCVPVLGGCLLCTDVGRVCISYMDRFGLAQLRDAIRRCCPGSGVSASALTVPGSIGVARGTNSGAGSEPRGRQMITSGSAVLSIFGYHQAILFLRLFLTHHQTSGQTRPHLSAPSPLPRK